MLSFYFKVIWEGRQNEISGNLRLRKEISYKEKGENFDVTVSDSGAMYTDAEDDDDEGGGFFAVLIVIFIVIIWLAILALLVKLDVGGFGSSVLYPVFKDVPVINKILPLNLEIHKYFFQVACVEVIPQYHYLKNHYHTQMMHMLL